MKTIPRMRTVPKAYEELKQLDPNTCFTLRALRRMVKNNDIPTVSVANKKLINFDLLLEMLSCNSYSKKITVNIYEREKKI